MINQSHHELRVLLLKMVFPVPGTNLSLNQYFAMDNAQFLFQYVSFKVLEAEQVDDESYVRKWPSSFGYS